MRRSGRIATLAIAVSLLGVAAVVAARLGTAGDIRHSIEARQTVLGGGYGWLGQADLIRLHEALAIDDGDPGLHEFVAFASTNARMDPAVAKGHLERAIALRPVSPYAWAALEANLYLTGAPVEQLEKPLVNAAMLGPSEPAVQRAVADFGLALWRESSPSTQEAVARVLTAGIRRDPNEFMQIAERRGRLLVACRHFDGSSRKADPKWTITCNRLEATS